MMTWENTATAAPAGGDTAFLQSASAELERLHDAAMRAGEAELCSKLAAALRAVQAQLSAGTPAIQPPTSPLFPGQPLPPTAGRMLDERVRSGSAGFDFSALLGGLPASSQAAPPEPERAAPPVESVSAPECVNPTRLRVSCFGRSLQRLLAGGTLLIGRRDPRGGEIPDLDLADMAVSRQHARIDWRDGAYHLTDLGSTNGTILNGRGLVPQQPVALSAGDAVWIGEGTQLQLL